MCGRFGLSTLPPQFQLSFGVEPPADYRPRWNITPDSVIVTIRMAADGPAARMVRWGMLGPWMKAANDPGRQINARSETAFEKPMFRDAIRKGRCLIPADGFYEWQKAAGGGPSQPYRITLRNGEPFAFAGLWRRVRLEDGSLLETCAILTTDAAPSIQGIHHRMPVMLRHADHAAWLDPARDRPETVLPLLAPRPDDELLAYRIGRKVNNPRADDPSIVEPEAEAEAAAPVDRLL
ncbi:MAG: SOS response-associated peptidase [Geminicoccaceae bacterium]